MPIKKTTTKAAAKAPTTKASVKAPAKAAKTVKKTAALPVKKAAAVAPVKKSVAPAVKTASKAVATVVTATIDIGFGNSLYIRGEGAGLSWDRGLPLTSADSETWTVSLSETSKPVAYKVLINDTTWCTGADYIVAPGAHAKIKPAF